MDRIRIGTFDGNGRFQTALDLNDGSLYSIVRDTLSISQNEPTPIVSKDARRYGGSRTVDVLHDNGTFEAEWYLQGASADATLALWDTFAGIIESADGTKTYFIEFRPDGATRSVYYEVRGFAWDPMYRWIEFASTKTFHVKVSLSIAPLASGGPLDYTDDFSSNTLSEYGVSAGSISTLSISGGQVVPVNTSQVEVYQNARNFKPTDAETVLKVTTGATVTGMDIRLLQRQLDNNNMLYVTWNSGTVSIAKRDGGTFTTLSGTAAYTALANTTYWLRMRTEGNKVTGELFATDPNLGGTPVATMSYTLAGADATKFGVGVSGNAGFRLTTFQTDWRFDDFSIKPFTYRGLSSPAVVSLPSIPGTAPADVDFEVIASAPPFGLIGWTPGSVSGQAFGVLNGKDASPLSGGWAATADANAYSGSLLKVNTSGAGAYDANWSVSTSQLATDPFESEVLVEVWARVGITNTVVSPTFWIIAQAGGGAFRYTLEWGTGTKTLQAPGSGTVYSFVRIGTIPLPVAAATWTITAEMAVAAGSSGTLALDYLALVPARRRVASPTAKTIGNNDAFMKVGTKVVQSDGSALMKSGQGSYYSSSIPSVGVPSPPVGGAPIELAPGSASVLVKLGARVEDPAGPAADAASTSLDLHAVVATRYHLTRGS